LSRPPFGSPEWLSYFEEVVQKKVPDVVIPARLDRFWVAGMMQTRRGRIQSRFVRQANATYLEIELAMVDPEPVFVFSEYVGLPHPSGPTKNRWRRDVLGLRALRVLEEIRPILLGQRLKEAENAIDFFTPDGIHPGRIADADIWSPSEFPWRIKRSGPVPPGSAGGAN
jgi:hypothetical protein